MKVKLYQLRINVGYGDIFGSDFTNSAEDQAKWKDAQAFAKKHSLGLNDYPAAPEQYARWSNVFAKYDCWAGGRDALEMLARFPREIYIDQVIDVEV